MQPRLSMPPPLYVGNLHDSVDEQVLFDFFSRFGGIQFIRVMRDVTTGKSRNYGFVNFTNARDAETAEKYAQYENINGQNIRIMYRTTINQEGNVTVKNLDKAINEKQLHEFFNRCGVVTSVHIRKFKNINMGFVNFSTAQEAEIALNTLNGEKLGELNLVLEKYIPKKDRNVKKSIYLKDLPFSSEEEANKWILTEFSHFGELASYKAFAFQPGIYSAFICFKKDEDSVKAYNAFKENPPVLKDGEVERKVYLNWHEKKRTRRENLSKNNIYVKNLKLDTTSKDLKDIFSALGKVENVALRDWESKDKKRKAKFGFILFESEQIALSVLRKYLSSKPWPLKMLE
jgi:RNA recognition motif-containing protein